MPYLVYSKDGSPKFNIGNSEELDHALNHFLQSNPDNPLGYWENPNAIQPKNHRLYGNGRGLFTFNRPYAYNTRDWSARFYFAAGDYIKYCWTIY